MIGFPLSREWSSFPLVISQQGSFGAVRKHDVHTGVDLYTKEGAPVLAIEDGEVVAIEAFTGAPESPWWLPTKAVLIEGASGVFVYGEVTPLVEVGAVVCCGQQVGTVAPVLFPEDIRTDIPGHSRFMLHVELHVKGTRETAWWPREEPQPPSLLDPTPYLVRAWNERALRS